jgi:SOS-response transcriptional repressor LexA
MSETAIETKRPTKKQRELLDFIQKFVGEHGYGPSYREIMAGCEYSSVATVAVHVNNLIARGHLRKKDRSARSLEITEAVDETMSKVATNAIKPSEEKWLVENIDYRFRKLEDTQAVSEQELDELYVLVGALKVLGVEGAAQSLIPRLSALRSKVA